MEKCNSERNLGEVNTHRTYRKKSKQRKSARNILCVRVNVLRGGTLDLNIGSSKLTSCSDMEYKKKELNRGNTLYFFLVLLITSLDSKRLFIISLYGK